MRRRIPLVVAALFAAATGLATPARAGDDDTAFLDAAHDRGITMEHGDQELISFAHNVCRLLADGYGMNALVDSDELHEANGISDDDVTFMVQAAAASYCPEYAVP